MTEWEWVPAGSVTTRRREIVRLRDGVEYTTMGVRWHGKGAYDRGVRTTETIKSKSLFRATAGDFVFNRIDTQKGAFDVVPPELDGALATNEFPLYVADPERLLAQFLLIYFQQESVLRAIGISRAGSEGRARWKESDFEAWRIPLPTLAEQHRIVDVMAAVDAQAERLSSEIDKLRTVFVRRKEEAYRGFAEDGTPVRLGDVLAEIKRPITVDPAASYRQIGVRSHGRGVFTKEAVTGEELGSKKVYWVEPGDLVINIVFAWEGAVALMPEGLNGYCGSHRFPTYRRTDDGEIDFFRYYFTTADGVALLGDCSPGGAGRNRTLNRKRLVETAVFLPDSVVEQEAVAEFRALETALADLEAELAHFRSFRSTLRAALLSHEVEIPGAYDALLTGFTRVEAVS